MIPRVSPFSMLFTTHTCRAPWLWLLGHIDCNITLPCLPLHRRRILPRKTTGTDPLPSGCTNNNLKRALPSALGTPCRSRLLRPTQDLPSYTMTLAPGRLRPSETSHMLGSIARALSRQTLLFSYYNVTLNPGSRRAEGPILSTFGRSDTATQSQSSTGLDHSRLSVSPK